MYNSIKYAMSSPDWAKMSDGAKRVIVENIKGEASTVADMSLYNVYPDKFRQKYAPENNETMKLLKRPSQKELNERLLSPTQSPVLKNLGK